jgi:V8-like Glu-specific endopeptidase
MLALAILATTASVSAAFSPATIYRDTASSVVLIFGFSDGGAGSSGTGSIVTADGLVLTNNHVVSDPKTGRLYPNLVVYFKPNPISGDNRKDLTTPYLVDVVARDPDLDLALLRVKDAPPGLRPVEIANSEEVDIGEPVAAIGHPGGGGLWTLTTGTISSKRRDKDRDIFQTDAAINPGNSGGPLFDEYARLIGVNTFVRRVNEQGLPLEGLAYSLRSALALHWLNDQGVTRVHAVSRASAPESAPSPAPQPSAPTLAEADAAPSSEAAPPGAEAATQGADAHAHGDAPSEPDARPAPPRPPPTSPPPPPEPEAREFEGPNGETMYGVPNPENDLDDALVEARKAYRELTERRDRSIEEMDQLLDDYDNF